MIGLYPGTFDPVTYGHLDIIKRASALCEKLYVGVMDNTSKRRLFNTEERLVLMKKSVESLKNVEVILFNGLQVDCFNKLGATAIVRGLRSESDFNLEFIMTSGNRHMNKSAETIFLMTSPEYVYISSSLIKEIHAFGGCLDGMVPDFVIEALNKKSLEKED